MVWNGMKETLHSKRGKNKQQIPFSQTANQAGASLNRKQINMCETRFSRAPCKNPLARASNLFQGKERVVPRRDRPRRTHASSREQPRMTASACGREFGFICPRTHTHTHIRTPKGRSGKQRRAAVFLLAAAAAALSFTSTRRGRAAIYNNNVVARTYFTTLGRSLRLTLQTANGGEASRRLWCR